MKRVTKNKVSKALIALLLVFSMAFPVLPVSMTVEAEEAGSEPAVASTTAGTVEVENAELIAAVDFTSTATGKEGTFNGDVDPTTATRYSLTDATCDDPLTAGEVLGLDKSYSAVFRVKTAGNDLRDQGILSLRLGDSTTAYNSGLYLGIPGGGTKESFYHKAVDANNKTIFGTADVTPYTGLTTANMPYPILSDTWHTVAIVQTESGVVYYVDGEEYLSTTKNDLSQSIGSTIFSSVATDGFAAYVGSYNTTTDTNGKKCNFKGSMDYFQLYNGALSATEVANITNASTGSAGIDDTMPVVVKKTSNDVITVEDAKLLAAVDFTSTVTGKEGAFNGDTTPATATRYSLTDTSCDDPLTAEEVLSLDKSYSAVFRVKTAGNNLRDQAILSLRLGTSTTGYNSGLYLGISGGLTQESFYHKIVDANNKTIFGTADVTPYTGLTTADMPYPILSDTWHTVAIVQTEAGVTYYVDGVQYLSTTKNDLSKSIGSTIFSSVATDGFVAYVGSYNTTTDSNGKKSNFKGSMDYFQFYSGALSASEVLAISNATSGTEGIDATMPNVATKLVKVDEYTAEDFETFRQNKDTSGRYTDVPTKTGYVFGGWYAEKDCVNPIGTSVTTLAEGATAYAKFVPADVLSVKAQITSNLTDNLLQDDANGAIRLVTTVDSLDYNKIGFDFNFTDKNGAELFDYSVENNHVYSQIYQTTTDGISKDTDSLNAKDAFCEASEYFSAYSFYGLKKISDYDTNINVNAFWVTNDGTLVKGAETTRTVNQQRTSKWVYLSSSADEVTVHGKTVTPYTNLEKALYPANTPNGVVCVLDDFTVAEDDLWRWYKKAKHVTITADMESATDRPVLTFTAPKTITYENDTTATASFNMQSINGHTTFSGISLSMPAKTMIFANGFNLTIEEDVTIDNVVRVVGGGYKKNMGSATNITNITLLAGNYSEIYGGAYGAGHSGDTHVTVAGNANKTMDVSSTSKVIIHGGSYGGNLAGDAYVTVGGDVNSQLDLENQTAYGVYAELWGGCRNSGILKGNTYVTVEGNAKFNLICGGSKGSTSDRAEVRGSTNVVVQGNVNAGLNTNLSAAVAQLYGGSQNGAITGNDGTGELDTSVPGVTNVTIKTTKEGTPRFTQIYAGGSREYVTVNSTDTNPYTNTNITIETANDVQLCRSLYGGSKESSVNNTSVTIKSGKILEVFGGSENFDVAGSTDVKLLAGEITGRLYGGCFNERANGAWTTNYMVQGYSTVTIEPDVVLSLNAEVDAGASRDDHGLYAGSRCANSGEKSMFIFNRDTYASCASKLSFVYVDDMVNYKHVVDASGDGNVTFDGTSVLTLTPDTAGTNVVINDETLSGANSYTHTLNTETETMTVVFDVANSSGAWKLAGVPECTGANTTVSLVYDSASIISDYDTEATTVKMQNVYGMTHDEVTAYNAKLIQAGWKRVEEENVVTGLNPIRFLRYTKGMKNLYVNEFVTDDYNADTYTTSASGMVKVSVILDANNGISASEASYTVENTTVAPQFYSYGLQRNSTDMDYGNAGQCQVIRTGDNKLIIIDGGAWADQMADGYSDFIAFLRQITGTSAGQPVDVAAWILTHFHNDHVGAFTNILANHSSDFNIERVISNMPDVDAVSTDGTETKTNLQTTFANIKTQVRKLAAADPNFMDIKVHTGDMIQLADVKLSFLYTHEDLVAADGTTAALNDFNESGCVFKVETTSGMSMLITGDINTNAENVLMANYKAYPATVFKSDIVQTPHHCFNTMTNLYTYTKSSIVLFTQARDTIAASPNVLMPVYESVWKLVRAQNANAQEYFDDVTVGFALNGETVERVYPSTYDRATAIGTLAK